MGSYYFGGERSFKMGDKDESELASYIVESNLFPQQTSLLGMLRFWILKNSGEAFNAETNKITHKNKAEELIGNNSFCADKQNSFGKIEKIGFCFLQKAEGDTIIDILPTPLDYGLDINFSESSPASYNGKPKTLPTIRYIDKVDKDGNKVKYTSKVDLIKGYIGSDGQFFEEEKIFKKDQRIGIDRNIKTGITEGNALYKQIFYRLKDGFHFAFCAEFANDYQLPANGQLVELGGDSSKFVLNYEEWGDKEAAEYKESKMIKPPLSGEIKISTITLLSDTLLDNSVVESNSAFSIAEHIPFRFLTFTTSDETNYVRTSTNDQERKRFSLFKRGSVFYFDSETELEKFEKKINDPIFSNIGYNNYQPKKTNNHDSNK